MDQFRKRHSIPKLTQEEIDILNRPIAIREIESMKSTVSIIPNGKMLKQDQDQDKDAHSCHFYSS